ncbi:MAG TPA: hypothetical protein VGS19_19830 [Streptosporangiaceae bacterium]|nr:hypothetical protein [Streptosporangiaceae bacterium]
MKTHTWLPHVANQAETVPVKRSSKTLRTAPLGRVGRGVVILALVLGGLGVGAVESSAFASTGHVGAHHQGSSVRQAGAHAKHSQPISRKPWMY